MGFLRFLLALSVLAAHSGTLFGLNLLPGDMAVEAFFIISGFYMAMVLNEKYFATVNYYKLFITNRFLRIYPLYWIVLALIITYYVADGYKTANYHNLQLYISYWHRLNPLALVYLIITNIAIIGQEFTLFFTVRDSGTIAFTTHFDTTKMPLFRFVFDSPLWSVSLELVFYLVSPFLVRLTNNKLLAISSTLLIARILSKFYGVTFDPFIYRLLPYQLIFFVLGILSYNLYRYLKAINSQKLIGWVVLIYISLFTAIYTSLPGTDNKAFIYLLTFALAMPFIFELSKQSKLDRFIGELSYPMYISHLLMLDISERILHKYGINSRHLSLLGAALTIAFSIALVQLISKRLELYRAKRVVKAV